MSDPTRATKIEQPLDQAALPTQNTSIQEPTAADHPWTGEPERAEKKTALALNSRTITLIAAGAVAALLLAGAGIYTAFRTSPTPTPLAEQKSPLTLAKEKCGTSLADYAVLGDGGGTLTLHGDGKESSGLSFSTLECYWSELKMPDSVKQEVLATRALDGRQSGDWDGIHASWSYHPDSGLQMVITVTD
ncbi:hypothetical protein ONA91_25895 [Micromonospora sp. DR5-3]|uniref:hypothetical protein n=1 Tax=unclassified Micromonospora TaxID=2617518 RepID=UPI0011D9C7AC|nr:MULTISPECIES: hypothetical protein [unclassified Micromonospora]MCW3817887.1 hypothetical protein [Micromonospora sp. DR5-3]TYC22948.1 hypothetical protein FXF52_17990 [Micromonospora sp. MP36]